MNKVRSIQHIIPPPAPHMVGDGFRVHNFFPSGWGGDYYRMSPFFLLDYGSKIEFPPSAKPRGVGVHPHRGFETVTIAFHGRVAHHDSYGNAGIIGEGDVQWMTAGSGVLHKEYHDVEYSKVGGPFQMVQLWVNLPAKNKMTQPAYQAIKKDDMPVVTLDNNSGIIRVLAGDYNGVTGVANTFSPITVLIGEIKSNGIAQIQIPQNYNCCLLQIEGDVLINEQFPLQTDHMALMRNDGDGLIVKAVSEAKFLLLAGEPIKETLVPYGPFLMNSKQEILQAYDDLNQGKFGQLED